MGMTSVRYTGVFDDPQPTGDAAAGQADHVIGDHADLLAALDLT